MLPPLASPSVLMGGFNSLYNSIKSNAKNWSILKQSANLSFEYNKQIESDRDLHAAILLRMI